MAVQGPIRTRHEDVFPEAVLVLSVEPIDDFDKRKAGVADPQERDKETGMRLWAVSVLDPTARAGQREIKVKIPAEQQPVPPGGQLGDVYFTDLVVIPYVDTNRARPRLGVSYRASGMMTARPSSGGSASETTGSTGGSPSSSGSASGASASGEGSTRSSRGGAK